jgi:hypothetical protein
MRHVASLMAVACLLAVTACGEDAPPGQRPGTNPSANCGTAGAPAGTDSCGGEGGAPAGPPAAAVHPVASHWWTDLDGIPTGAAREGSRTGDALGKVWSHFGQGQENDYGYPEIVSASQEGLPAPPAGSQVIKMSHQSGDPATQHKLLNFFTAKTWPNGGPYHNTDGSPADVSGRYITYLYIPSAPLRLTQRAWINLAQLKESYSMSNGSNDSDPSWWLVLYNKQGNLVLDLAHWFESQTGGPMIDFEPYLDQWVKIEMRLYQHDRLEIYLNDKLFDTVRDSEYPVGRLHYVGRPVNHHNGVTVTREEGWVFGTGNYSNPDDPGSNSLVYVGPTTVLPLP